MFRTQLIDGNTKRVQLNIGNLNINLIRHEMNPLLHLFSVPYEMKRGEELHAERKIHDLRGMPVSRCKVYQPAFCQEIKAAPIRLNELSDIIPYDFVGYRACRQLRNVDFDIKSGRS